MKFNVKIITDPAEVDMDKITKWIYYWWGKNFHFSKGKIKSLLTNSCNDKKLPITCVAFAKLNGGGQRQSRQEEAGICQIVMNDLDARPDVYPCLANVYVAKKYRGNGLVKQMLDCVLEKAKALKVKTLYLYTRHKNLYDKYGWEFLGELDTYERPRIQRLYKYTIK